MHDLKILKKEAQEVLDISPLEDLNIDLLDGIVEQLTEKLDVCARIPIVSIFSAIHKVSKSFFDYKMCIRFLKFYLGCENINQEKRDKFYKRNVFGKEEDIGYKFIQLLDRLDADEKALLIGKLFAYCIENEHDINTYFRICRSIEKCYYDDLRFLVHWKSKETICSQNKLIPQEIMESLYSGGLLSECGFNGGGFKVDDDSGTIYALNKFGGILLNIIT